MNEQISELADKLKMANAQSGNQQGMQQGMENPRDAEKMNRLTRKCRASVWMFIARFGKVAAGGRGATFTGRTAS